MATVHDMTVGKQLNGVAGGRQHLSLNLRARFVKNIPPIQHFMNEFWGEWSDLNSKMLINYRWLPSEEHLAL